MQLSAASPSSLHLPMYHHSTLNIKLRKRKDTTSVNHRIPSSVPTIHHTLPFNSCCLAAARQNHKETFQPIVSSESTFQSLDPADSLSRTQPQPLASDTSLMSHTWRDLSHEGVPITTHRGMTTMHTATTSGLPSARTFTVPSSLSSTIPISQPHTSRAVPRKYARMNGETEYEWMRAEYHSQSENAFTFRPETAKVERRGRVRERRLRKRDPSSVPTTASEVNTSRPAHASPFAVGANQLHQLFDTSVKAEVTLPNQPPASLSATSPAAATSTSDSAPPIHSLPFRHTGLLGQTSRVGNSRAFIGGAPQHVHHHSPYQKSERESSSTSIANGLGTGFRIKCRAHSHHTPLRVPAIRSSHPCETDRNPKFHAIYSEGEICRHKCREGL